jgi:5'-methylthioadenosine phosphorylase
MLGIIGGTGLGEALFGAAAQAEPHTVETPFGAPSGPIRIVEWHGTRVALLARHGDGHVLNPTQVPYRANIYALKSLGVTHILASGAVGSLREEIAPRDLVIVDQVIDKTFRRANTFFDEGLAVHVEFAEPFCNRLRRLLLSVSDRVDATVHDGGTYVCMEGPAFSTVAESNMHRAWGGSVIGMTAMPEAKLAREAEIPYALVALATDYDCWRPHDGAQDRAALLEEILGHLRDATQNALTLMRAAIERFVAQPPTPSPIETGLDLAVWSRPDKIAAGVKKQYGVLLERYLQSSAASA